MVFIQGDVYHLVFELGEWLDGRVWPEEDQLDVLRLVDLVHHVTGLPPPYTEDLPSRGSILHGIAITCSMMQEALVDHGTLCPEKHNFKEQHVEHLEAGGACEQDLKITFCIGVKIKAFFSSETAGEDSVAGWRDQAYGPFERHDSCMHFLRRWHIRSPIPADYPIPKGCTGSGRQPSVMQSCYNISQGIECSLICLAQGGGNLLV